MHDGVDIAYGSQEHCHKGKWESDQFGGGFLVVFFTKTFL